jgi:hypothetical protein
LLRKFGKQVVQVLTNGRIFAMIAFGCVFFAFAGPFGSFSDLSVGARLLFWFPVFLMAFLVKAVTRTLIVMTFRTRSLVQMRIIGYLVFSGVFSPLFYTFLNLGPVTWGGDDVSFAMLSSWVLLTAGTCTALFAVMNPEPIFDDYYETVESTEPLPPRLFRRLDVRPSDTSIVRLTVNDHYVVVGLSDGSEQRLLMRLSDAIAEMDDVLGYITHRSHWVSQTHVKRVVFEGKREMLELTTGVRVPISRTYRPVLAAAGVIPEAKELSVSQLVP